MDLCDLGKHAGPWAGHQALCKHHPWVTGHVYLAKTAALSREALLLSNVVIFTPTILGAFAASHSSC